jgi:hypothetical protein
VSRRKSVIAAAASAAPTTAATTASSATTTTATFAHGAGFVHHQRAAHELFAVAGFDGPIGCPVIGELGESKASRLTREFVPNNLHGIGVDPGLREKVLKLRLTGLIGKVANKQFLHRNSFR